MADASYFTHSPFVRELKPTDFDSDEPRKLKDSRCTAVLFYANWCRYCKAMQHEWEDFAAMAAFYEVAALDAGTYPEHVAKIKEDVPLLIPSFPTIVFYRDHLPVRTYDGPRTAAGFLNECMEVCGAKSK